MKIVVISILVVPAYQNGYCVKQNNGDQNSGVIKINNLNIKSQTLKYDCLKKCHLYSTATGCEVIWDQGNRGCYVHTQEVARGNGVPKHGCWIFNKGMSKTEVT